jgi:hypothetical protein
MLFITHVVPRGLQVDEVIQFGGPAQPQPTHMAVVDGQEKA